MKIRKRDEWCDPKLSMYLWIIPTMGYLLNKIAGIIIPGREWIWFVTISMLFGVWFMTNFVITKK